MHCLTYSLIHISPTPAQVSWVQALLSVIDTQRIYLNDQRRSYNTVNELLRSYSHKDSREASGFSTPVVKMGTRNNMSALYIVQYTYIYAPFFLVHSEKHVE